jgi:hypothetical protein
MLLFLLLGAAIVLTVETASRLPIRATFGLLVRTSLRAGRVLGYRRVLERRKERCLHHLSARMLLQSLRAGALLAFVMLPVGTLLAADALFKLGVATPLLDWQGRLLLLLLGPIYALIRFGVRRRLQHC